MHDELEHTSESHTLSVRGAIPARLEMLDVRGALLLAEKAAGSRVIEGDALREGIVEAATLAGKGERVALLAPAEHFASSRDALRRVAASRLGFVAHAIAGHGAEDLAALTDLGWGVLSAAGPEDSFDLALVARRASEDCGVPFLVVHGLGRAEHASGRAVAMVGIPHDSRLQGFIGAAPRPRADVRGTLGDRAYLERVPFALGSALRDYGSVSGRRHDVLDKVPLAAAPLVLVGTGPVGDALLSAVPELRARGYDVGAIHLTSLRPFPGPRLVKALARALAVTVLEPADEPFAHGALLARDVKSAFTDALTWVPGFPGIGRIPKLFVGATGSAFDISDLAAVCENMLADERGRRIFSFTDAEQTLPRATQPQGGAQAETGRDIAMRFVLDDAASAEAVLAVVGPALANGVGLRAHGIITAATPGTSTILDLVASRDHARGGMARRPPRIVLATERGMTSSSAIDPLRDLASGEHAPVLGLLGEGPSGAMPEAARTVIREQRARVIALAAGDGSKATLAIVAAGAALAAASCAARAPLDGAAAARVITESANDASEAASARARRAFETTRDAFGSSAGDQAPARPNAPT